MFSKSESSELHALGDPDDDAVFEEDSSPKLKKRPEPMPKDPASTAAQRQHIPNPEQTSAQPTGSQTSSLTGSPTGSSMSSPQKDPFAKWREQQVSPPPPPPSAPLRGGPPSGIDANAKASRSTQSETVQAEHVKPNDTKQPHIGPDKPASERPLPKETSEPSTRTQPDTTRPLASETPGVKSGFSTSSLSQAEPKAVDETLQLQPEPRKKPSYSLQDVLELVRHLPKQNPAMVFEVVIRTLQSTNISIQEIIATGKVEVSQMRRKIEKLNLEITAYEKGIIERKQDIQRLQHQQQEAMTVLNGFVDILSGKKAPTTHAEPEKTSQATDSSAAPASEPVEASVQQPVLKIDDL